MLKVLKHKIKLINNKISHAREWNLKLLQDFDKLVSRHSRQSIYKIQTNTNKITAVVIFTPWKIQFYCRFVKLLIRILVFLGSFVTNLCFFLFESFSALGNVGLRGTYYFTLARPSLRIIRCIYSTCSFYHLF